jgi:cytochrome oxidase assembly protein ShyY1
MNFMQTWKRWIVWLLVASLFAVACVFLSQWQFSRRAEAVAKIDLIAANFDKPAVAIAELTDLSYFDLANEWRPVALEGKFLSDKAVLVRNRPYNGNAGFLQVVPFQLSTGEIVAVETGWLPTGSQNDEPDVIPLPSSERVEIIARIRPAEPTLDRDAPQGQIATINIESLISKVQLSEPIYKSFYVRLAESYNTSDLPKVQAKPQLTEGNHLSYALQWILFALMAFSALWWAIWQERQIKKMELDPSFKPKRRKQIGDDDKAAEDGIA